MVHCDNDVNPGFHYYEAEGTALNKYIILGSTHSRITQCLKSIIPQAGFDQDMSRFEELAGTPTPDGTRREASEAEPPHDGRPSTIYKESEADIESHVMEVWYVELQEERELPEAMVALPGQQHMILDMPTVRPPCEYTSPPLHSELRSSRRRPPRES
eukprot:6669019-Pyramimonas_sp.AAC.1